MRLGGRRGVASLGQGAKAGTDGDTRRAFRESSLVTRNHFVKSTQQKNIIIIIIFFILYNNIIIMNIILLLIILLPFCGQFMAMLTRSTKTIIKYVADGWCMKCVECALNAVRYG